MMPICTTPKTAEVQAMASISVQHKTSFLVLGWEMMLAKAMTEEMEPRTMKSGARPAEVPFWMILTCWGIYETSIPITRKLQQVST